VAPARRHALEVLIGLAFAVFLGVSCSASDSASPAREDSSSVASPTTDAESLDSATQSNGAEPTGSDNTEPAEATDVDAQASPRPSLVTTDFASIDDVDAGEQIRDAQGNLIAIYGFTNWSESFANLSDEAQTGFPFFGDVEALADPSLELVALDVGMCSAGIDATGFGTAEFFVHDSPDHVLSAEPVRDRGVLARHPVIHPSFGFPSAAECTRGWLPALWGGDGDPAIARYVLTTRVSVDAEIERHLYQWKLPVLEQGAQANDELFGIGQTVTFNDGTLQGTTVVVDGWAELIGSASDFEGVRRVGVSLNYCPATARLPEFGLAIDGWNLISPVAESDLLGGRVADDVTATCFDGWLEFDVPFGGIPTAFFASDGVNATTGYAEWSLENGALPTPG